MGLYNIVNPTSMVAGQPEDVSQVLANFQAIQAVLNGGIDDVNIRATAAFNPSKILGYPSDSTKELRGDGSWMPAAQKESTGLQLFAGPLSTGPNVGGFTGSQAGGVIINPGVAPGSFIRAHGSAGTNTCFQSGLTTDTQPMFQFSNGGKMSWGPGGSTATDTFLGRLGAGVLGDTSTSLSTGPINGNFTGSQVVGTFFGSSGQITSFNSVGFVLLQGGLTTDTFPGFQLNYRGQMQWSAGTATQDVQVARQSAGRLILSSTAGGARWDVVSAADSDVVLTTFRSGESQTRFQLRGDGSFNLGAGGATGPDTTVKRASTGLGILVNNFVRQVKNSPAYGTSVVIDASLGSHFTITVTNATAFTIANPINPPQGSETQTISIEVLNSSGGAMGTITWGTGAYVGLSAGQPINWANPATTKKRMAVFVWNGSNWVGQATGSVDY